MQKIEQKNNLNSYSDLFIYDDKVVKIYTEDSHKVDYNMENVTYLLDNKDDLLSLKELVLPISKIDENIKGFIMPYIKGKDLYTFLDSSTTSEKLYVLNNIYDLIERSNINSINICDFHENNIIIDENLDIHFIDCDNFVINGNELYDDYDMYKGKYIDYATNCNYIFIKHDINSDYFSLYGALLNYLSEKNNLSLDSVLKGFYISNNDSLNNLLKQTNINEFTMSKEDLKSIINNLNNISFKEKYNISQEFLIKEIEKVRKMAKLL